MKVLLLFSLSAILSIFTQLSHAVNCPNTNYNLNSQTEVDAFPGGCDAIRGRLVIDQTDAGDPITNLNSLTAITSVGRYVQLRDTTVLTDTSGLGNLSTIGRYLLIRDNTALTSLSGFSSLTTLGNSTASYLQLRNNDSLTDISSLLGLSVVAGNLNIRDNNVLTNIDGLAGITSVGSYLRIQNNTNLADIDGLSSLASVGSYVLIRNNDMLTTLNGLTTLSTIGSYLQVRDNNILANISALGGISNIPGYLQIRNNDMLTTLGGLEAITTLGSYLQIRDNNILANVDALAGITTVPGYLMIRNNDTLPDLDGLAQLVSVSDYVQVRLNNILDACTALIPLLDTIDDDIPGPGIAPTPDTGGAITINTNGNTTCNSQADILASVVAPGFSQIFTPNVISISATVTDSTLEFTIENNSSIVRATELTFSNTLPAGLNIAATPNAIVTCTGGTLTAVGATTSISYNGGLVDAASSCSVKLDVVGTTEGVHTNTADDLTFTLGNSGDSTAMITVDDTPPVITIPDPNPLSLFVGDTFSDPAVTAIDAVDGTVTVTPSGTVDTSIAGIYTRTYTAQDSVGNADSEDLTVEVVVRPIPVITLTPSGIDFGVIVVGGSSSTETVTITNSGTAALNVSAIDVATVPFALVGGNCATPPFTLAVGVDCTLEYTFSPTVDGAATESLTITSNAATSPTVLTLDGEGLLLVRTFTGPLPSGNTGTLSFTTTDATCSFEGTPVFLPSSGLSPAPPADVVLIDGVAQFVIRGCAAGATVDLSLDYGVPLPTAAAYWKQGSPWRQIASTVSGSSVQFSITDGGTDDDDGIADGRIVDPSGMAMPPPVAQEIPTLPLWALVLLCLALGWLGKFQFGSRPRF